MLRFEPAVTGWRCVRDTGADLLTLGYILRRTSGGVGFSGAACITSCSQAEMAAIVEEMDKIDAAITGGEALGAQAGAFEKREGPDFATAKKVADAIAEAAEKVAKTRACELEMFAKAFIGEVGCHPSEAELVEEYHGAASTTWHFRRRK